MGFFSGGILGGIANVATGGLSGLMNSLPSSAQAVVPMVAGAGIGALAGNPGLGMALGSGVSGILGAQQQNQAAAVQVAQQEAFQERMSGTAYQRAVADMKLAGINPMLASGQGGASTPGGSVAPVVPEIGPGVSSAFDALNTLQNLKESNSRVLKNIQDTSQSESKTYNIDLASSVLDQQISLLRKQNTILGSEAGVVGAHPELAGWMKVLSDRGVGTGTAMQALSLLGE